MLGTATGYTIRFSLKKSRLSAAQLSHAASGRINSSQTRRGRTELQIPYSAGHKGHRTTSPHNPVAGRCPGRLMGEPTPKNTKNTGSRKRSGANPQGWFPESVDLLASTRPGAHNAQSESVFTVFVDPMKAAPGVAPRRQLVRRPPSSRRGAAAAAAAAACVVRRAAKSGHVRSPAATSDPVSSAAAPPISVRGAFAHAPVYPREQVRQRRRRPVNVALRSGE